MLRPLTRLLASFYTGSHDVWTPFLFVLNYLINESQKSRLSESSEGLSDIALQFAVTEAIKLILSLVYYLWRRPQLRSKGNTRGNGVQESRHDEEEQPLNQMNGNGFYEHTFARSPAVHSNRRWHSTQARHGSQIPWFATVGLALAFSACLVHAKYDRAIAEHFNGPFATSLAISFSVPLILIGLFSVFIWTVGIVQYQAVIMQVSGFLIIQAGITTVSSSQISNSALLALSLSTSLAFILISYIYRTQHRISLEAIHVFLFTVSFLIHLVIYAVDRPTAELLAFRHIRFSFPLLLQCITQSSTDLLTLMVIFFMDAPTAGILISLGTAIHFITTCFTSGAFSGYLLLGSLVIIVACVSYLTSRGEEDDEDLYLKSGPGLAFVLQMTGVAFFLIFGLFLLIHSADDLTDIQNSDLKAAKIQDLVLDSRITCRRKPLPSATWYPYEREYHAFDNVLLIVFFSHARYDVNLDSYREVYAEFFPNMVFVGPRSRQDAGFNHSYDVLVDSYEAEEDLTDPTFYKMAGRMAHHMLYTALDAYPCYDGYLWAPFDTLLNIPRLQQFDQKYFWYHSPFGTYVPNPALGDEITNANKSRHAPPLLFSPDPDLNLTETWKGWQTDWWWGDPHVGLDVCMRAFRKVPLEMRENLAALTNGTTRLIGGSADTLYIPGHHRQVFLDTLGLFLETTCFLEIATPTVVHLVRPLEEPIQFVDHWWIWQPPFNASFVRQKWTEGFEVDTFHTFHWGDVQDDGVWRGNPAHIPDVRRLLVESAERQKVDFPIRIGDVPVYKDEST
ncbi:hypothetical protein EIP91_007082 [Steccherinum ochraceum]|uniref:Uncharacterized protein n=1 Tax=Steccherinum ochraceum TaxID=92696 RepID=A0A4R0RAH2_9APHY|nr:hypothetical protein EIP91_007082 [Steccherinum ochraceum]